jgi:tetratricopeptide (TPR) repeat protein
MLVGAALALLLGATGCDRIAVWAAPEKTPTASRSEAAGRADELFWRTLHRGEYDRIPEALTALKAAYLENPRDAVTASHIGWLHIWRLGERARHEPVRPEITDDAVLARKYFEEAVRMNPKEPRYLGFYASLLMAEGTIHQDEKMVRRGFFTMKDAIAAWPEFNYFTAGYSMSTLPADSPRYREALEYQWLNLDACAGEKVDRTNPDYARYMRLETKEGPRRVCWNSWIAPHNFEGFFLNFGDMLVKAGQPDLAVTMYRNARHAREYAAWPYKAVLEGRIRDAASNVEAFRRAEPGPDSATLMVRSTFACMGCHQR